MRIKLCLALLAVGWGARESLADRGAKLTGIKAVESHLVVLIPLDSALPVSQRNPIAGIVVDRDGMVLAGRSLSNNVSSWEVVLADGRRFNAKSVDSHLATDIALIQLDNARDLPSAEWTNPSEIEIGMDVIVLGTQYPEFRSVCFGLVSAVLKPDHSRPMSLVRIDSYVSTPVRSSLVFDLRGRIVGYVPDRNRLVHNAQGLIMAITTADLRAIVDGHLRTRQAGK